MSSSSPIEDVLFPEVFWGELFILRVHNAGLTHPANKRSVVNGRVVVSTNQNARLSSGESFRANTNIYFMSILKMEMSQLFVISDRYEKIYWVTTWVEK